ncbi:MAG: 30S ribosomal protein S20 [bacterium]|nr:30S ribosomal protein S20 [bacterium]
MANMKNAKKKINQIKNRTPRIHFYKATANNAIKNTDKAIMAGDKKLAQDNLAKAIKSLDVACSKGIIHQNKVSREKSRLTIKVNNMA